MQHAWNVSRDISGERLRGRLRLRWEDIKMDLPKKTGDQGVNESKKAHDRVQ